MYKLRAYQAECIKTVVENVDRGVLRQLIVLPTGGGKTVTAALMPKYIKPRRVLFLAHREELIDQAARTLCAVWPNLKVGVELADQSASHKSDIIVGSVPTLGRKGIARLRNVFPDGGDRTLVITDECHHSYANTYQRIYEHFGLLEDGTNTRGNIHVGITATPFRGDGKSLSKIFDEITFTEKIGDLILNGWLVDVKSYKIDTGVDISGVRSIGGDYHVAQLSDAINNDERNNLVYSSYKNICDNKKTIIFCANIQHALDMKETFSSHDVSAETISADTDAEERRAIIDRFRSGGVKVVTNCSVLTEGFDVPDIESIIIARPTKSPVLYTQMIGRGMRPADGKTHMTLIDLYDVVQKPSVHADRILNVPGIDGLGYAEWKGIKDDIENTYDVAPPDSIVRALSPVSVDELRKKLSETDVISILRGIYITGVDSFLSFQSKLMWTKISDGSYVIKNREIGRLAIRHNVIGLWELWMKKPKSEWEKIYTGSPKSCFKAGDNIIHEANKTGLYIRSAKWREKPPTPGQLKLIGRLTRGQDVGTISSRGEASFILNALLASK